MNRPFCFTIALALSSLACNAQTSAPQEGQRGRSEEVRRSAPEIESHADVVDRVAPSVVTIRSSKRVRESRQYPFAMEPSFEQFFGRGYRGSPAPENRVQRGMGSGVVVREDGYIVTNHHVIDGAEEIIVEFTDGMTHKAKLIGDDPPSDLAVLKLDATKLKALPLGDSDRVRVGDVSLAVGNPLGVGQTVTAGIISAKGRTTGLSDGTFEDFLQTDAPINQGNSGGALVNTAGQLIGINSQILSPSGGNIGIGFAIPVNMMRDVMDQLIKTGRVRRGQLGVTVQAITPELASGLKLPNRDGVLVGDVTPGGPADKAGFRSADVILSVNGQKIDSTNRLRNAISSLPPGSDATVAILRDGKSRDVQVKLGEFGAKDQQAAAGADNAAGGPRLGVSVAPLTPELAAQLGVKETSGLVVREVEPAGAAAQAGITAGDIILQANRQPVKTPSDLQRLVRSAGESPVPLLVNRRGRSFFVIIRPN